MKPLRRTTKETDVEVALAAEDGASHVDTTIPFLDHMVATFARYSGLPLSISARGDLPHHLIEDVAITVGMLVAAHAPVTAARYGDRTIPMDDALVQCVIDLGDGRITAARFRAAGDHWMRSFSDNARATLHLRRASGHRPPPRWWKPPSRRWGLALRDALRETGTVFSTKGATTIDVEADAMRWKCMPCGGGRLVLSRRVVVCLDVRADVVVKGVEFQALRDIGDPELAQRYERAGADEIVFLDISASQEAGRTLLDVVRRTAGALFIPLTVGGGIGSVDDIAAALRAGADKVSMNSAAVANPGLLTEAAARFGAQCVVASIDAKREGAGWRVFSHAGSRPTALDAWEWAERCARSGAGEILYEYRS